MWNPWLGNGTPLLANLQSAVFYPPNLLYLLLPVEHGLTLSVILHLGMAGLFMYVYTRQLGLMPFAATISALAYMLSGYLVGRTQFVTMVNAAPWLPLALLLCERIVTQRGWSNVLWLGLTLAAQFLAGHAQLWFYTLLLIGAYTLVRGWQVGHEAWRHEPGTSRWTKYRSALVQAGGRLSLAVLLALLLAAVQILPTAEFTAQSPRGTGAERTFALTYSFWPWRLITLLAPNFFGHPAQSTYWGYANYWEDHAYLGILPFVLALSAIWRYFRRPTRMPIILADAAAGDADLSAGHTHSNPAETNNDQRPVVNGRPDLYWQTIPFFTFLIPTSLILAMGWNTPIYLWLFDHLPGFGYFQGPARLLIWYTIAMAVLAGAGAQLFIITPKSRPGWRRLLVGCLGLGIAGLAGGYIVPGRGRTFMTATLWLGVWLSLAVIVLLRQPNTYDPAQPRAHPQQWQWLVISLTTVDLLLVAFPLTPTLPATLFTQPI
ncbi:MAG: YfhO family protein, partial [Anaerolineae bacterium]|nr:YfhO family protein [Anaerolineae bacterium]